MICLYSVIFCVFKLERRWCIIGNPHCDDQNELFIFNKKELRMYCDDQTPVTNRNDVCWDNIDKIRCSNELFCLFVCFFL